MKSFAVFCFALFVALSAFAQESIVRQRAVLTQPPLTGTQSISGRGSLMSIPMFTDHYLLADSPLYVTSDYGQLVVEAGLYVRGETIMKNRLDIYSGFSVQTGSGELAVTGNTIAISSLPVITRIFNDLSAPNVKYAYVDVAAEQSLDNLVEYVDTVNFDSAGKAVVVLRPEFTSVVDTTKGYQVFASANDDVGEIWKTKQPTQVLLQNKSGKAGSCDIRVVGKRRNYEGGAVLMSHDVSTALDQKRREIQ